MIDILLSLRPRWMRKILTGEKVIELRKSMPHCELPVRILLYETKQSHGRGAVVGECICYLAEKIDRFYEVAEGSCVPVPDIEAYSKGKSVYGWYLGKVITYERPHPIYDYGLSCAPQSWFYIKGA